MRSAVLHKDNQPVRNLITNPAMTNVVTGTDIVGTNVVTNPSFESIGALATIGLNLCTNPNFETNLTGWSAGPNWTIATSTANKYLGTQSLACTRSNATAGNGYVSFQTGTTTGSGSAYTLSAYVYGGSGTYNIWLADGSNTVNTGTKTQFSAPGNTWTRVTFTFTASSAFTLYAYISDDSNTTPTSGSVLYVDAVLIERTASLSPYYDGSTVSSDPDISYVWDTTANASLSRKQGVSVVGATNTSSQEAYSSAYISSSSFAPSGKKTMRLISTSTATNDSFADITGMIYSTYTFKPNTTYTISGDRILAAPLTGSLGNTGFRVNVGSDLPMTYVTPAANVAGTTRVVATFTTGSSVVCNFIRVQHGGYFGSGDVWWDNVVLEEGVTSGTYYDGNTPTANGYTYSWTGTANNSNSQKMALASVNRTNLITNPCMEATSGTTTFGTNLAVNPNMETVGTGSTVIGTNLCTNPNFETNLTGWAANPSASISLSQQSSQHYVGSYSMKISLTAASSGGASYTVNNLIVGQTYTASGWVYVPAASDNPQFIISVTNIGFGSKQTVYNTWTRLSMTWTATSTSHSVNFGGVNTNASGDMCYLDAVLIEQSTQVNPYYDGSSSGNGYTYSWSGTANASTSRKAAGTVVVGTNLITNPALWVDSTNWNSYAGQGGNTSVSRITASDSAAGSAYYRSTWTTASTYVQGGNYYAMPSVSAGTLYSASMYVRCSKAQGLSLNIEWYDSNSNKLSTSSGTPVNVSANTWANISISAQTAPASAVRAQITAYSSGASATTWAINDTLDSVGLLVESSGAVNPYYDGFSSATNGLSFAWTGTPGSSTTSKIAPQTVNWNSRWYGSTGGSGYTYAAQGMGMNGGTSIRKLWTVANTGAAMDTGINPPNINVSPSTTYSLSIYMNPSVATQGTAYISWFDSTGASLGNSSLNGISTPASTWTRISATATSPTGAATAQFIFGPYNGAAAMPAGSYIDYDQALIEAAGVINTYYDGSTAASGDFTYQWTSTTNASTSTKTAPATTGWVPKGSPKVYSSTAVPSYLGAKSLAVYRTDTSGAGAGFTVSGLTSGQVYTMSGYVYIPTTGGAAQVISTVTSIGYGSSTTATGTWTRLSYTFTATATSHQIGFDFAGTAAIGQMFYLDSVMLEYAGGVGAYFDGSNGQDTGLLVRWTGTANASTSQFYGALPASYNTETNIASWMLPTGGVRVNNYRGTTNSLQTPQVLISGRTYTLLIQARTYNGGFPMVYGCTSPPAINLTSSYAWYRVTVVANADRFYLATQNGYNSGFDILKMMIVEGSFKGNYADGSTPLWKWDGAVNASSSVGYPV